MRIPCEDSLLVRQEDLLPGLSRHIYVLLVILCLSATAFGQTATEGNDPDHLEAALQDDAVEGMLPVPDYSGGWTTRPFLSGDWGGSRQDWANMGIIFDLNWLQIGQGVVSGGVDKRWAYATNLDYNLSLDLARMNIMPGALITFRGQSRFGSTVNDD